jgi:hypothetical protein
VSRRYDSPTAHSRRDQDRVDRIDRVRAAGLVVVLLAAVLVAGSTIHAARQPVPAVAPSGLLPSVNLASHASLAWDCPGPLPAGGTADRSAVIVVDPGLRSAEVMVNVAATSTPASGPGTMLAPWSAQLTLAPHSEQKIPLRTSGPAQTDAVSVVSTGGAVAVFESVTPFVAALSGHAGHGAKAPPAKDAAKAAVPEESPCAVGTSTASYIATGSTLGKSSVTVALFDPTATEAVVGLTVSTGSASVAPPALQGLILRPDSVQVFDIGRWVVQQPTIAVTVAATVGRVVAGGAESQGAAASVSGEALLLGVQRPQPVWTFAPGPLTSGRITLVRVYDPGTKPAAVTISSTVPGHPAMEITAVVPAAGVRAIALPLPTGGGSTGSGRASAKGRLIEGPIVVRSAESVGVVVARMTSLPVGGHGQIATNLAVTSGPASDWVLPTLSAQVPLVGSIEVANPSTRTAQVTVLELTVANGRVELRSIGTATVRPGSSATVRVSISTSGSAEGFFVRATGDVVVEQDLVIASTAQGALPLGLSPLEGIPATN